MSAPIIYRLAIERFRCITTFSWHPTKDVNLILGGGDVGKTTILDAIGLLFSPTNPTTLADTDYHARNIEAGFVIEAILSLPPESGINQQTKASWPWDWNGSEAVVRSTDGDGEMKGEPVYRLRVRGTGDLELAYEVVQPDGTADPSPDCLQGQQTPGG
jgi:putative ATP-dependent endonuclease of OLD family